MKLIILGPPGSGKGTQAKMLAKQYKLKHISIGKILRDHLKRKTKIGLTIRHFMERGDLVPNEIVDSIIHKEIKSKRDFIIDGFPRDINQAKIFKGSVDKVICLTSSRRNVIKRLLLRKRADDSLKVIKHRWKVYKKDTSPVIRFYKKQNLLLKINGNPTIEEVYKDLIKKLNKLFFSKNS
ncbi:MAG: nucleoside monophosphate kinase [Nanoarchaeota archaeon]|nr:nucleoside monophosphate kinase [Nanoarchaeota archaeon]